VVEAAPKSGSLITARLAAEQGREVMAVPGSPLDPRHRGTNQLLRDGAALVENADDVHNALGPLARPAPSRRRARPAPAPDRAPRPSPSPPPRRPRAPEAPAADVAGRIHEHLGTEPLLVDELIRQCHATSAEVQQALLDLELAGRLQRHPGNRVALAPA
jgi:DNA processing protein